MSTELKLNLAAMETNENIVARNYWRKRLKDLELRSYFMDRDTSSGMASESTYADKIFHISDTALQSLHATAPSDISKHVLLLSCLAILLRRYSSVSDIAVFTPAYCESSDSAGEDAILPVRVGNFTDNNFRNFIMTLKYNIIQDFAHSNYPLEKMLHAERKSLTDWPVVGMLMPHIQKESLFDTLSPDMLFSFKVQGPASMTIRYDESRFNPGYIEEVARHYLALLNNLINNGNKSIDEIEMITVNENLAIINELQHYPDEQFTARTPIPASYHQERLWFIDKFEAGFLYKGGPVYHNIPLIIDLEGVLNIGLLKKAIGLLLEMHDALRTSVINTDEGLIQKIDHAGASAFSMNYIKAEPDKIDDEVTREINTPFELDKTLVRAMLLKISDDRFKLILTIHHIIADRHSGILLVRDLFLFYKGLLQDDRIAVNRPGIQYSGFSIWQRESLKKTETNLLSYWKLQLGGKLKVLKLPSDQARSVIHTYTAGVKDVSVPVDLFQELLKYEDITRTGINVILMAAFKILLHKYAQQEEIIIGTSADNRCHESLRSTIGPIDNLIVLRSYVTDELCFNEYVRTLNHIYKTGVQYGLLPFDKLVKELAPEKDMSRTALFDVFFQYQDEPDDFSGIRDLKIRLMDANLGYGKYDLSLFLKKEVNTIQGKLVYNSEYYHGSTVTSMVNHYCELLKELLSRPDCKLSVIDLLSEDERVEILREYDYTHVKYPADKTIADLFTEQAGRTSENIALVFENRSVTYRELDGMSDKLAFVLRKNGVLPGTIVGLLMDRSVYTITGILAIIKAGGAYLPIDSDYPDERIAYFIQDSGAGIILTTSEFKDKVTNNCTVICADHPWEMPDVIPEPEYPASPSDLCYIIYTSGTTGNPKGVMIRHKNVVRLFFNDNFQFNFGPDDVWTMFHSHCFDFSVWEIFGALLFGGKLVIIPKMVARDTKAYLDILKKEKVSILNQTPGSFYNLVREELLSGDNLLKLKYVIFGGEALSPGKLKQWKMKYPDTKLINMFGITETTVHVTYKEIGNDEIENNISNIGKPIPTLAAYILDANQRVVPKGAIGELYVGGEGVAQGYLGNRSLTEKRFINNPYNRAEKLYRSGDLVKRLVTGDLEFICRIDHQVQLRGFRVELGEIESHLAVHDQIKDAVVVARERDGDKFLVAYYVSDEVIRAPELRRYLLDKLPDYMVPSYFVYLEKMPLTQNGKLDRDALPQPEIKLNDEYVAPANDMEKKMVEIWAEVLGMDKAVISVNSSFFDLGGHSLLAPVLISIISDRLKIKAHLKILYQYQTIAALTECLLKNKEADSLN